MSEKKIAKQAAAPFPPMSSEEGYRWERKARKRKKRMHRMRRKLREALRS